MSSRTSTLYIDPRVAGARLHALPFCDTLPTYVGSGAALAAAIWLLRNVATGSTGYWLGCVLLALGTPFAATTLLVACLFMLGVAMVAGALLFVLVATAVLPPHW